MKLSTLNLWFSGALLLLVAGCGSQTDTLSLAGETPSLLPAASIATATGQLELVTRIASLGPVSKFRITGFDSAGQVVFGPSEVEPSSKLEISAPVTMTLLQVLLVSGDQIVGGLSIPTSVIANTLTSLPLPEFVTLQNDLAAGDSDFDIGPISPSQRAVFSTASQHFFAIGPLDTLLDFELTRPGSVGLERFVPGVYLVGVGGRYFLDYVLTGENMDFLLRVEDAGGRPLGQATATGSDQGQYAASLQQIVDLRVGDTVRLFARARSAGGFVERGLFTALRIGAPVLPPPP